MQTKVLHLVERIIARSSKIHPADDVLRQSLKSESRLAPELAGQVSRAVFAYYRWFGWLDPATSVAERIASASDLAREFTTHPKRFSDADLLNHAVPAWTRNEVSPTPDWLRAIQAEPRLWLRARPGQGTSLAATLRKCRPFGSGLLSDTLEYLGHDDLFRSPAFHGGEFELQDISSQAVSLACDPKPGETWFDACAGEGGKLLHLSDLMKNKGLIWAADRAPWRLQRLKRRAARAKVFNYRVTPWDGGERLPTKTKFDGILVDAPCSGIGTWQRNPHARWTTTPDDIRELAQIQIDLLSNVAHAVKPGGKLVYAVCALSRAETTGVAVTFEQRFPDFTRLPISNPLVNEAQTQLQLFLWPQDFGGNGMFIAAWSKR
jgi:16S rRNA (cytosine967-C5)-methyltransferase